jgi:hypothetical protein
MSAHCNNMTISILPMLPSSTHTPQQSPTLVLDHIRRRLMKAQCLHLAHGELGSLSSSNVTLKVAHTRAHSGAAGSCNATYKRSILAELAHPSCAARKGASTSECYGPSLGQTSSPLTSEQTTTATISSQHALSMDAISERLPLRH